MKLSSKYRKSLKIKILYCLICVTICCSLLAVSKLANFGMPEKVSYVYNQAKIQIKKLEDNLSNTASSGELACIKINGKEYKFEDGKYDYNFELDYNVDDNLKIEYIKKDDGQIVNGDSNIILITNEKTFSFDVISKDKTVTNTYNINVKRPHSAYLKNIYVQSFGLNPSFSDQTLEYGVTILGNVGTLNLNAIPYDKESIVKIDGNENFGIDSKITITVTNPYVDEPVVYTLIGEKAKEAYEYNYSGGYQEFIAPYTGNYKFECYGAPGGHSRINGSFGGYPGNGGYAKGEMILHQGEKYYVYVGQKGTDAIVERDSAATWNGGGLGTWDHSDDEASGAGGGATDIRLQNGNWNDASSLASRIMVAGGGRRCFLDI